MANSSLTHTPLIGSAGWLTYHPTVFTFILSCVKMFHSALHLRLTLATPEIHDSLRRERQLAMLFITHDLELASALCDRVLVMYAGRKVEEAPVDELGQQPRLSRAVSELLGNTDRGRANERGRR